MKKVKCILLVVVAGILIFCCYRIVFAPHSYRDVVSREIDNIQPSINTSSFESLSVQKFNDTKYYLDENNELWLKSPKEEKICARQVAYFLVWQNRLIYTTTDNLKAIYEMPLLGDNKKAEKRLSEEAQIIFCDNQFLYIYTAKKMLLKYDHSWKEIEAIDMKKKGVEVNFERACVVKNKIVFCTESDGADGFDMYFFDLKTKYIQKVPFSSKETNEYAIRNDVVRWRGEIYYLRCSYNDGDMNNSFTRAESIDNGIYRLNLAKGKFEKISEDVGEFLIVIDNNLCVVRDSFMFGMTYKKVQYAATFLSAESLYYKKNREEINSKPINQDGSRLNTIDAGVYFYDTTWITNYSQVQGNHYYWLRYDANAGKYIIYQDNRVKIGKFELPYQFEDDIPYFLDGFAKYGSDFYAIISSMDTEKEDDDNQIQQLAKVNLKKENLEIIYDIANEHIAGDGEKLFCCIYKDYFYLDSRTKWQSYDKRAGKPVRIDIKGKTMEKLSTTTNMKKASPYLSYINDKIFYAVNEGKKTSLFSYNLKENKEQCFLKLPSGENDKTDFVRLDKDFIYYGKYIISRKDKKTFHVLKSGDKNVISNEKYVFYLDKANKIHRLDKQNKYDIIIRKKPATEISCTEKNLFARVRNKKAYTKCIRDAADADEFADSGEDFYSDNLYCLDLRGREENKIWKGSYKIR